MSAASTRRLGGRTTRAEFWTNVRVAKPERSAYLRRVPRLVLLLTLAALALFPARALADPLAGYDVDGSNHSSIQPGRAEIYRIWAARTGSAAGLALRLDNLSQGAEPGVAL